MNILDIIRSDESLAFEDKFGGAVALEYFGDSFFYGKKGNCYFIPDDESAEDIFQLIKESLKTGKDLLFEKYKKNIYENELPEGALV